MAPRILKIKMGNNPTSSATTYQLLPTAVASMRLAIWLIWGFFGIGLIGAVSAVPKYLKLQHESLTAAPQDIVPVTVQSIIATSLFFFKLNFRKLAHLVLSLCLISIPGALTGLITGLIVFQFISLSDGPNTYSVVIFWLLFAVTPTALGTVTVTDYIVNQRQSFQVRKVVLRYWPVLLITFCIAVFELFFSLVIMQNSEVARSFPTYYGPDEADPLPAVGILSANIPFLLELIAALSIVIFTCYLLQAILVRLHAKLNIFDRAFRIRRFMVGCIALVCQCIIGIPAVLLLVLGLILLSSFQVETSPSLITYLQVLLKTTASISLPIIFMFLLSIASVVGAVPIVCAELGFSNGANLKSIEDC